MSRKKRTVLAFAMLGVFCLATVFVWNNTQVPVPFTKSMQTNGYHTFIYAATLLVSDGSGVSARPGIALETPRIADISI